MRPQITHQTLKILKIIEKFDSHSKFRAIIMNKFIAGERKMPNFIHRNVISCADRIIRVVSLLKEISSTLLT